MDTKILKTKLHIPSLRRELVPRPRLVEQFKAGFLSKLILVSAPAGFGKTTMIIEGISGSEIPAGWVSLDEGDNDTSRFWLYFISSLQTVQADIGKAAIALLQSSQAPPIESILTTIINEISEVSEEFALVLDDYHMIETQSIHDSLTFFLNNLPPQAHLVISSRIDPPLPLAHLRAQNQLLEVRAADLRFIRGEATVFLNDIMGLELSDENITELESRTEGWIASLQLAALSMKGHEDVSAFITAFSGSNRYILDYLIEEVLQKQEEGTQSFLLKTAVLDSFTAALCDAVTLRDDSRERLAQLETTNLFIVPLDDERQWYRYHHLFADLLRNHLLQSHQEQVAELHVRASNWFEQEGLINEAIYHALDAGDFERAANLIEPIAASMVSDSRLSTLLGWLARLPDDIIGSHPWLAAHGAWANLFTGRFPAVEPLLASAEARLSEDNDNAHSHLVRSNILAVRAFVARHKEEHQRTIELSHESLKRLPLSDLTTRSAIMVNLGITYFHIGDMDSACKHFQECSKVGSQSDSNLYAALTAISYFAEIQMIRGNLHKAYNSLKKAIRLGNEKGWGQPLPATGYACAALGQLFYEWNDLTKAADYAVEGIKLGKEANESMIMLKGHLTLARIRQAQGNDSAVREAIEKAEDVAAVFNRKMETEHVFSRQARISLAQVDLKDANRWAASPELTPDFHDAPDFWSETSYLTLVRKHIARGEISEIPGLLEHLSRKVEAEKRTGSLIEILILQSIVLQARGDLDNALARLEHALSLAEPEGYIRTFVDEGEAMAGLLRLAMSRGIAGKYVRKLLASFRDTAAIAGHQPGELSAESTLTQSPLVEPLSKRELEVLRLIVAGMSNREIAEKLIIGKGTVKTHVIHIFSKLGVQSRTQAIARARELNLL